MEQCSCPAFTLTLLVSVFLRRRRRRLLLLAKRERKQNKAGVYALALRREMLLVLFISRP
jgi:hypothetical protein